MANSSFYKDKTILVAGASGFVGTHLSNKLHELGANVVATYNKRIPNDLVISSKLQCDFTKYDDCLKATQDVDYVFMCAANTSGAAVMEKTPLAHLTPNVVMNSQTCCI